TTDASAAGAAAEALDALLDAAPPITRESLAARDRDAYEVREIEDGETGVTYGELFAPYLEGATHVEIVDPYIRQPYQVRNVEQFVEEVGLPRGSRVSLTTMYQEDPRYGYS